MLNLLKLRQPYLNIEFNPDKRTRAHVIERPGLWMTPEQLSRLLTDLRKIVASLGIGGLDYGITEGKKESLDQAVVTIIYDKKTGEPFAFNALTLMNCVLRGKTQTVVHLGLVVVDPSYRAKGLSWVLYGLTTFLLFFKNRFKPVWVSNVTQVPSVLGNVSESFGNVFPHPVTGSRRTYDHLVLAREIMTHHRGVFGVGPEAEFDEEKFVVKNSYTGGSDNLKKKFETATKHRNEIFNKFCQDHLDYDRGDDFIQLGQMDVKTYYNYMKHQVPAGSKVIVIYKLLFSLFEISLVPIFQWFSPSKQMGVLRPRGRAK